MPIAAAAMTVKLEDTASLLTEVTNVFTPEDDIKITEKFLGTQAKIKSATEKKQAEIKEIIRGALPTRRATARCTSCRELRADGLSR